MFWLLQMRHVVGSVGYGKASASWLGRPYCGSVGFPDLFIRKWWMKMMEIINFGSPIFKKNENWWLWVKTFISLVNIKIGSLIFCSTPENIWNPLFSSPYLLPSIRPIDGLIHDHPPMSPKIHLDWWPSSIYFFSPWHISTKIHPLLISGPHKVRFRLQRCQTFRHRRIQGVRRCGKENLTTLG